MYFLPCYFKKHDNNYYKVFCDFSYFYFFNVQCYFSDNLQLILKLKEIKKNNVLQINICLLIFYKIHT